MDILEGFIEELSDVFQEPITEAQFRELNRKFALRILICSFDSEMVRSAEEYLATHGDLK